MTAKMFLFGESRGTEQRPEEQVHSWQLFSSPFAFILSASQIGYSFQGQVL